LVKRVVSISALSTHENHIICGAFEVELNSCRTARL
jgi:hypothetical protein